MTSIVLEHFHGAACRVTPTATAFPTATLASTWSSPVSGKIRPKPPPTSNGCGTPPPLAPYTAPRTYMNYAAEDEADRLDAAYGPNVDRLRDVKRRYDPDNLFRLNRTSPFVSVRRDGPSRARVATMSLTGLELVLTGVGSVLTGLCSAESFDVDGPKVLRPYLMRTMLVDVGASSFALSM